MELIVDEAVSKRARGLSVGIATIDGVSVKSSDPKFNELRDKTIAELKERYTLESLKDDLTIGRYRDFLWKLKLDPTKMRPTAEALLRRVLRGSFLPRINNVVDATNLCAVKTIIPMSVYDAEKIFPPLTLRFATKGEEFIGIEGIRETLTGNEIVMSDEKRIIHLYPCRDCEETKVGLETSKILLIAYGAPGITEAVIRSAMRKTYDLLRRFAGGRGKIQIFTI